MKVKAYKGFDKNLRCRGFRYKVGKEYKTNHAEVCECGFHACQAPLDVFDYYSPADSRYCEVEQDGHIEVKGNKQASTKLKVVAEIGITGLVKAHIKRIKKTTTGKVRDLVGKVIGSSDYSARISSSYNYAKISSSGDDAKIDSSGYNAKIGSSGYDVQIGLSGDYARIGSSGDAAQLGSSSCGAQIGSSGDHAKIGSSGYDTKIGSSGYSAKIGSSGRGVKIGSSGDSAKIGSSGNDAHIGSSGAYAQIGSSGDYAKISSSGRDAKIDCEGDYAVIACAGIDATVRAPVGAWVCLPEYNKMLDGKYKCVNMKAFKIDGKKYPADKYLKLQDGKVVVVE